MSMATTLPSDVMRSQMRRKAHRLSGHGASISTVVSESALVSANLTRTPSRTRKYVDSLDAVPVLIRGSPSAFLAGLGPPAWPAEAFPTSAPAVPGIIDRPVCLVKGSVLVGGPPVPDGRR